MKTLIVTSVEVRQDKNDNDFHVVEISTPSTVYTQSADGTKKAIKQKPRTVRGITGWVTSNLDSMNGRPDYEATLEIGDEIQGDIVTRKVKPYFIPDGPKVKKENKGTTQKDGKWGRMVDTASVVVFADSDDEGSFDIATAVAFKRKGHVIVEQTAAQSAAINKTTEDPALVNDDEDEEDAKPTKRDKQASKSR